MGKCTNTHLYGSIPTCRPTDPLHHLLCRPDVHCQLLCLRLNSRRQLQCLLSQRPSSATVFTVPTHVVSYSVYCPNAHRQLQCLLSQRPSSVTVSVVPTPVVSHIVFCPNTRRQLQCLLSQHPSSVTASVVITPVVSYSAV